MDLTRIKLIIWDLDETLWDGTISETEVRIKKDMIHILNNTLDCGIVHSICSKNDYEVVKNQLIKLGLWEYFVFPSINWESKGGRIQSIINRMKLRNENVLFVDDNVQNLNEAQFFCEDIMIATPEELVLYFRDIKSLEKRDMQHKRLKQYKMLEKKEEERGVFTSNTEFLCSCNITVTVCQNCEEEIERIYELISRTNQLNYTKYRQDKDELALLLQDKNVNTGYVRVNDKFGDYGIVGFYAIQDNRAIHYLFSCRTLGMLVEQYVYMLLGCPDIEVADPVVTKLNKHQIPVWINTETKPNGDNKSVVKRKMLLKGPCDMLQIFSFLKANDNIVTEFTYQGNNGSSVEGHNCTAQIVTALKTSQTRKRELIQEFSWFDDRMLDTALTSEQFDVVVLSMLTDGNLGVYEHKNTGEQVALCEKHYDLTNADNHEKYLRGEIFTSNIVFSESELIRFSEKYDFVDDCDGENTIRNLEYIHSQIGNAQLILLLGSERPYLGITKESFINRHEFHAMLNRKIEQWACGKNNVILLPFGKYVKSQADYVDTINHFAKRIYYELAHDLIKIVNQNSSEFKKKSKVVLYYIVFRMSVDKIKSKMLKFFKCI